MIARVAFDLVCIRIDGMPAIVVGCFTAPHLGARELVGKVVTSTYLGDLRGFTRRLDAYLMPRSPIGSLTNVASP